MSTHMTVGEVLEAVQHHRLKQSVVTEVIEYLNRFIATDSHVPKDGIASPISSDVIPSDVVEEVRDELYILKIKMEKEVLEMTTKPVSALPRKKAGAKKKVAVRKATKKATKKAAKRSPPTRRKSSVQR